MCGKTRPKKCPAFKMRASLVCLAVEPVAMRQRTCSSNSGRMPLFICSCRTAHNLQTRTSLIYLKPTKRQVQHRRLQSRCGMRYASTRGLTQQSDLTQVQCTEPVSKLIACWTCHRCISHPRRTRQQLQLIRAHKNVVLMIQQYLKRFFSVSLSTTTVSSSLLRCPFFCRCEFSLARLAA